MNDSGPVYLDYNATTPLAPELQAGLMSTLQAWGNPSSIHWAGRLPKAILRETRAALSTRLNVSPLELIFTSGGTESNNTIIKGVFASEFSKGKNVFVTSTVEHPSVARTLEWLSERGAVVIKIKVDKNGQFDLEQFEKVLVQNSGKIALVSVMMANNETGSVFPLEKIARLAHAHDSLVHSDCVQVLGKMSLDLTKIGLDYASFSAHKFYSLKGVGVSFIKKGSPYEPLIHGGAQERSRRGGTENPLGLWAFGEMSKKLDQVSEYYPRAVKMRDELEADIMKAIPGVRVTAATSPRLPNTSSLIIEGIDGETLLMSLDLKGFAVSTGAACSSGSPEPSPVLLAMGLTRAEAQSSLRVSLGWNTTQAELSRFVTTLKEVVERLRAFGPDKNNDKAEAL